MSSRTDTPEEKIIDARAVNRRGWRRAIIMFCTVLFVCCSGLIFAFLQPRKIHVSEETTYITSPLREDGLPDYERFLNDRYGSQVPDSENAMIPLLQLSNDLWGEVSDRSAENLGLAERPQPLVPWVASWDLYQREEEREEALLSDDLDDQARKERIDAARWECHQEYEGALSSPWKEADYPLIAAWLDENAEGLAIVQEASAREKLFEPIVMSSVSWHLPFVRTDYDFMYTLLAKGMLELGTDRRQEAFQTFSAAYRLAQLLQQNPGNCYLVYGFEAQLTDGLVLVACTSDWKEAQYQQCIADLEPIPEWVPVSEMVGVFARCYILNAFIYSATRGRYERFDWSDDETYESLLAPRNKCLRMINAYTEQWIAILALPTHRERRAAFEQLTSDIRAEIDAAPEWHRELPGNDMYYDCLEEYLNHDIVEEIDWHHTQARVYRELSRTTFALAAYRARYGAYPETLEALVPEFLETVPMDAFADAPLRYRRTELGYALWSVGSNMTDDGDARRFLQVFGNVDPLDISDERAQDREKFKAQFLGDFTARHGEMTDAEYGLYYEDDELTNEDYERYLLYKQEYAEARSSHEFDIEPMIEEALAAGRPILPGDGTTDDIGIVVSYDRDTPVSHKE